MRRVAAKFVPKLLSCEQKELRLDVAQDMLECANGDLDFLKAVITGDESIIPKAKESKTSEEPSQSDAVFCFFLLPRSCASRIRKRRPSC
jgi:hypothetical protein